MRVLFTTPNVKLEAFRFPRAFPDTYPEMFETWILLRVLPKIRLLFTMPNVKLEAFRFDRPAPFPKYARP